MVVILLLPAFSHAQPTIDADYFFSNAIDQIDLYVSFDTYRTYVPWIEKYELRTETRDLALNNQEYTFRVSPSTFKIRKAQKDLLRLRNNAPDFQYQENQPVGCFQV